MDAMALFPPRLPDDVRSSLSEHLSTLDLPGRARVLAWTRSLDGAVVALPDRLAVLGPGGVWSSVPWHEILRASWTDDGTRLFWHTIDAPLARHEVVVTSPGRLPEVVLERVGQTIVMQQTVELAPGRRATLTGRRPAVGDGEVRWSVVPSRGVDLSRPDLAEAARLFVERAQLDWA